VKWLFKPEPRPQGSTHALGKVGSTRAHFANPQKAVRVSDNVPKTKAF